MGFDIIDEKILKKQTILIKIEKCDMKDVYPI